MRYLLLSVSLFFYTLHANDAGEKAKVLKTFDYLKIGYEKKKISFLQRLFVKMSDKQKNAYERIFKVTDDYQVNVSLTNIRFEGKFARADATLDYDYVVNIGAYKEPRSYSKSLSYLLFKAGSTYKILGAQEHSESGVFSTVTEENVDQINKLLKQLDPEIREQIFKLERPFSKKNNRMRWEGAIGANGYVVSITKEDISKVENVTLFWKKEDVRLPDILIPEEVFDKLTKGEKYYFNAFAYDKQGNNLSGQIFHMIYRE